MKKTLLASLLTVALSVSVLAGDSHTPPLVCVPDATITCYEDPGTGSTSSDTGDDDTDTGAIEAYISTLANLLFSLP